MLKRWRTKLRWVDRVEVRRACGSRRTQVVSRPLPVAVPEELPGQGLPYGLLGHPRTASGPDRLPRTLPPLRGWGLAAHPFDHGARHAGGNGGDTVGDQRASRAGDAGIQSPAPLPRQRRDTRVARGLHGPGGSWPTSSTPSRGWTRRWGPSGSWPPRTTSRASTTAGPPKAGSPKISTGPGAGGGCSRWRCSTSTGSRT